MQQMVVQVKGMKCKGCADRVEKAVDALEGVKSVDVDLAVKSVKVLLDMSQTGADRVCAAIKGAGYEPGAHSVNDQ
jgi:copper ion binding protein